MTTGQKHTLTAITKMKMFSVLIPLLFIVKLSSSKYCSFLQMQTYTCERNVRESYAESYETGCKLFGWWRCQRYREAFRYTTLYSVCTRYVQKEGCCQGWSGPTCNTHSRSPEVDYCPRDKTVTAVNTGTTNVTWATPRFSEPHGYPLAITSTYGGRSARLSWGTHEVRYTARSRNNNKEAYCSFTITVNPPPPEPKIKYYTNGRTVERTPGGRLEVTCYAMHSYPAMRLSWYLGSTVISQGARYWTEASSHSVYRNSYNKLVLPIEIAHDRQQLICKGTRLFTTKQVYINIKVDYNPDPVVGFCPRDQTLISPTRDITVSWIPPEFYDINGDPLKVFCSLPGINSTTTSYVFDWGEHDIIYTAQNTKTGREATCSFKIKVQTKRCPKLQKPENGALVCGTWTDGNTDICKLMCQDKYDHLVTDKVASIYVCGGSGEWFPSPSNMDCSRPIDSAHPRMPSDLHYYSGDCSSDTTQNSMVASFLDTLESSFANETCRYESCNKGNVKVEC